MAVRYFFVNDVEDKPWYNDRAMWPEYLDMLATQRFNRFNLSFGIGYDFLRNVTDGYMLFTYPFLLAVPKYNVRVPQLPDAERDANLAMLQYISEETVTRGLQFQLGLWMHGYEWLNSPNPNYTIEGLTAQNHAAYCRDAVRTLLKACPAVSGVTFRVHGESGVNEGSYDFWRTVFEGVATCGRVVEIDMHAKGMDQTMVDSAVATKLPIVISPKYWAEHLGMPYHQADIRDLEVPKPEKKTSVLMNLSEGSRSFIRYGYGDLLREDRPFKVLHRIWPGTQRLLLSGDPVTAAAHARVFSFCGSAGVELMEPLSFKGRRGSGLAGDRCGYQDASYKARWDWEKYLYSLRVFGRMMYNPETDPDVWQRLLRHQFAAAASPVEAALANATRILPIVLTAHGASAGNNTYWPEVYTNQPIVDPSKNNHYTDTPAPKSFGNVSPLDPQLFSSINACATQLLKGEASAKYTPIHAASWLEGYAAAAEKNLDLAASKTANKASADYKRMRLDVMLQAGLGKFFAAKFRSGVLYAIFEQTGDRAALEQALTYYRKSRDVWAALANQAKGVYRADITAGERPFLRGHWLDRLPAIDEDITAMAQKLLALPAAAGKPAANLVAATRYATSRLAMPAISCAHTRPDKYMKGQALPLAMTANKNTASVRLWYRHVNQAERYQSVDMTREGNNYRAEIPASYTGTSYPIAYYFEVNEGAGLAGIYPGFGKELTGQPYFVVRSS